MTAERPPRGGDAIGFGKRILSLLDQGRFTAPYKYAVLLVLIEGLPRAHGR